MGGIRRIKRELTKKVMLGNTGIVFNDCKVLLQIPEGQDPNVLVKQFQGFMGRLMSRSNLPNIRDIYSAHLAILKRIEAGEPVIMN